MSFRNVSDYLELSADEEHTAPLTAAGDPATVAFEDDVTVGVADYTLAAIGEICGETPASTFDRTPDGWTVIDAVHLGNPPAGDSSVPGEANVTHNFVVNPLSSHPAEEQ